MKTVQKIFSIKIQREHKKFARVTDEHFGKYDMQEL